jgi:ribosomal protein L11 methyltransferase
MYLWRKTTAPHWLSAREKILGARARGKLAIIARPDRKRLQLEVACLSRVESQKLVQEFGGHAEKLSPHWLKRSARVNETKQLKIGRRLLISRKSDFQIPKAFGIGKQALLVIPASTAFGTGDHATTALSLRLLEQLTRQWNAGWSIVDLGTGSGILALSAKCFGAEHVVAIDLDPVAISTAKTNAQLSKIDNVDFRVGDLRRWKPAHRIDIVTANLFSQLLIEILPKLKRGRWLILSGVLRDQEKEFIYALRRSKIDIVQVRRRGKWSAVLAKTI